MSEPLALAQAPPPTTPTLAMLRTLGLVSAVCGLIIVASYELTLNAVKANKRLALEKAVAKVVPDVKSLKEYVALADGKIELAKEGDAPEGAVKFFATFDGDGKFLAIAAEAAAKGYADLVRVMYAYKPACECITGIGVVGMNETPGIGDKIITDKEFQSNFKSLDVKLNTAKTGLAHEVLTVKHGSKSNPWQIDAIAGATVTSRALGKGINHSAQALLPRVAPNLDKIRSQE